MRIIWTNTGILLIRISGTNFSDILSEIHTFPFQKIHLKISTVKWRWLCFCLNGLILLPLGLCNETVKESKSAWRNKSTTAKWLYWAFCSWPYGMTCFLLLILIRPCDKAFAAKPFQTMYMVTRAICRSNSVNKGHHLVCVYAALYSIQIQVFYWHNHVRHRL